MRRVLYISGTRADYGPARRLLSTLNKDPEVELSVLVTGMHLDPVHGETWREIQEDGLQIVEKVHGRVTGDEPHIMSASIGLCLFAMSQAFERLRPDVVLVLGDRGEQLAGAIAGATQNIPVVHLCGGASSGSIDDSIRHAITKFAHLHLVGFDEHADRVIQMGEVPSSVAVVGFPGGDLQPDVSLSRNEVCRRYGLEPDCDYVLVVQHAVTHSSEDAEDQIVETLEALATVNLTVLLANPNDDAGGRKILARMEATASHPPFKMLHPPGNREVFASVMAHAAVLVGNSSSALVEAMSVGLPVVNIGDRQSGREHLACWINVAHDRSLIRDAVAQAMTDESYRRRLASHQARIVARDTSQLVLDHIKSLDLSVGRRQKTFYTSVSDSEDNIRDWETVPDP